MKVYINGVTSKERRYKNEKQYHVKIVYVH